MTRKAQTVILSQIADLTVQTIDPGSHGYSQAQLDAAFSRVQNPDHWKGAIDCLIQLADEDRDLMWVAVVHFTATEPTFRQVVPATEITDPIVEVEAAGYWAGPAS